jgi:5-formyltetrahydrofolate cyclo-ligase
MLVDLERKTRTLYGQVAERLLELVVAGPLNEETLLPPEWALAQQLNVSRGTVRQAAQLLEEAGLLTRQRGRGTFVNPAARLRHIVWARLVEVARPDSRFDLDLTKFIPDFEGSEVCLERLCALPEYRAAKTVVVMPDNNLESTRAQVLADGKRLLACTYAMLRGFVLLDGKRIASRDRTLAATLDGMERFSPPLSFEAFQAAGPADLVVTGATGVTRNGVHFGKGQGYLDMEWGLLRELGLVDGETPVVASVHDCQVIDEVVPYAEFDVTVDVILTPSEALRCGRLPKPPGIFWDRLPRELLATRPYLEDLRAQAFRGRNAA